MAYVANVYQGDHVAATDLQNIENNFEYLRNNFKSGSAPADPGGGLEGVIWWDSTKKTFKGRSDSEWRGIFSGNADFKIWAYLDSVPDGWTRDTTVTDEVLAFKGGSTYTTGAQRNKGSWTISGLSTDNHASHTHSMQDHTHTLADGTAINDALDGSRIVAHGTGAELRVESGSGTVTYAKKEITGGPSSGSTGNESVTLSHTTSQDGTWRIKAAVGIMLYPKL
jgi:hypothetical protein